MSTIPIRTYFGCMINTVNAGIAVDDLKTTREVQLQGPLSLVSCLIPEPGSDVQCCLRGAHAPKTIFSIVSEAEETGCGGYTRRIVIHCSAGISAHKPCTLIPCIDTE